MSLYGDYEEPPTELRGQEIGHGVHIRPYVKGDDKTEAGIIVEHKHEDGKICLGAVPFDLPVNADENRHKWTVVSREPLTLDPSVNVIDCPLHGWIKDGQWTPA